MRATKHAFTLIELLVVIAIIALLLAIIIPAAREAKKRAMGVFSLSNLRNLTIAWLLYIDENDGNLPSGEVWGDYAQVRDFDWVHPVISTSNPEYTPGMSEHERELAGIRQGSLFPYTETEEVFNCPGDKTWLETSGTLTSYQSPFRSLAVSWPMNGQWGGINSKYRYTKIGEIPMPANRLVFLEEEERGGANWGSWILPADPANFSWWDPIAIWHSRSSTNLGFADGHSEGHHWVDRSTLELARDQNHDGQTPYAGEGEDLEYIRRAYHHAFK